MTPPAASQRAVVGKAIPDMSVMMLSGKHLRLSGFSGRPLIINFWASWCIPCIKEFPRIKQASQGMPALQVLGVVFEDGRGPALKFERDNGATWSSATDADGAIARAFGVTKPPGIPQTFFVDAKGILRSHVFGEMSSATIDENLAAINPRRKSP